MTNTKPVKKTDFAIVIRKYLVSAFVVASFSIYVIHQRNSDPGTANVVIPAQASNQSSQDSTITTVYAATPDATSTAASVPTSIPQAAADASTATAQAQPFVGPIQPTESATGQSQPTQPPAPTQPPPTDPPPTLAPTAVASSGYKDGQFTGDIADAFYGNVQVKVVIQKGKIIDVQFLDYPHDRRTSVAINNQAVPWLQTEALQAQSAQVDIISGATLTSQAFIESMQFALNIAKS